MFDIMLRISSRVEDAQLEYAVHCIDNFDAMDTTVCFLYTNGRSGSLLLHSLLDNHDELILMPRLFPYYSNYNEKHPGFFENIDQAIQYLLTYSGFTYENETINFYLGDHKNESIDLDFSLYGSILRRLCHKLQVHNSRTFLLAIHYAYALYKGQNIHNIRSILLHHHHSITSYQYPTTLPIMDYALKKVLTDFPNAKFMHTIRHPYAMYMRSMAVYTPQNSLYECWRRLFLFFIGFYQAHLLEDIIGPERYDYVRMEDIHRDFEATIRQVCRYLNIQYSDSLKHSTLDGKLWWGLQPETHPVNGINPNFKDTISLANLDPNSITLCRQFLRPLLSQWGYTEPPEENLPQGSIFKWTQYERHAFKNTFKLFLNANFNDKRLLLVFLLCYPFQRYRLMNDLKQLSRQITVRFQHLKPLPFWLKQNAAWLRTL